MTPRISAIIPTYNRAVKVQGAIDSVLAQTFTDFEVVVVDDGSSDGTCEVLRAKYGDSIRYFAQPNQGISGARNRGITEARGEWIAFLDSDDIWEKEKLDWQIKALEEFSPRCGACYTDVRIMNHPETRTLFELAEPRDRHQSWMGISARVLKLLVRPGGAGMVVCPSSLLARTDLARKVGGLNRKLKFQMDTEFMFRLALETDFCYVNKPLVKFDRSPAQDRHVGVSAEWNKVEFIMKDSQIWLEGLLALGNVVPQDIRSLIRNVLGSVHSGLTNCHLQAGKYADARKDAWRALRLNRSMNIAVKWLLTCVSPSLALRTVQHHQANAKQSAAFI
ncbi:MAG TPA: glycosyltransferase [Terriglobales bacterium]|nr:glycosyltransferase [Terriglobales bacterium]